MSKSKPPKPGSMKAGCGCLVVVALVVGGVGIAVAATAGGGKPDPAANQAIASTLAQNHCHDLVAARLGSGIVYSKEETVADQKGVGPHLQLSGLAAQNGTQYAFLCTATANLKDGSVSGEQLAAFTK